MYILVCSNLYMSCCHLVTGGLLSPRGQYANSAAGHCCYRATLNQLCKSLVLSQGLTFLHFSSFIPAVNRIKEQYKVLVRIPQDSERSSLVRIEGDPKGVQLARRELIEMVQRMVGMGQNEPR